MLYEILVSALVIIAALINCTAAGVHELQLEKVPFDQQLEQFHVQNHIIALAHKYDQKLLSIHHTTDVARSQSERAHGGHELPIENLWNGEYYSIISLGTPPQEFKVILDTGSANIWVPGSTCNYSACRVHSRYNASLSSTHEYNSTKFSTRYGTGGVSGYISQDTLWINDLEVKSQLFAEATSEPDLFIPTHFDGILGLGHHSVAINGIRPPFYNMLDQGLLDESIFSFYTGDTRQGTDSVCILGGANETKYEGEVTYLPLRRPIFWETTLDALTLGNETIDLIDIDIGATLDTGTTLLAIPTNFAELLNLRIGATQNSSDGLYYLPCTDRDALPNLTFTLSGHDFGISAYDYVLELQNGRCISTFQGLDTGELVGPLFVLGDAFLRRWYSVFDLGGDRVGLAKAV